MVEDPPDRGMRALVLAARVRPKVDALEHERTEREHRGPDLVALPDLPRAIRGLDEVVDERVDPGRPSLPEELDLGPWQLLRLEDPEADRVVDVVVDVGDPVDQADDLALERRRLLRAGMGEDPVPDLGGQVQLLRDPERLLVVPEAAAEALAQAVVELLLPRVAEGRVAGVVAEPDRLGQVLVQPQGPCDDARDPGRLERMGHARAVVVAGGVDEDLRFPLQPPERLRVENPVAVALEGRPQEAFLLLAQAAPGLVRADGER
jgi:hypothetical protein